MNLVSENLGIGLVYLTLHTHLYQIGNVVFGNCNAIMKNLIPTRH